MYIYMCVCVCVKECLADTSMSLLMRTAGSPTENCGVKVFNKTLTLTLNLTLTLKSLFVFNKNIYIHLKYVSPQ